jgi:hypothetical protein
MSEDSNTPNIEQNNQQILSDIESLQTIEQDLFNNLENNPNLTTQQQTKIIDKINNVSNMRINLYQTLSGINNYFQGAMTSSQGILQDQSAAISIVETELNKAKRRLKLLEEEKNNKIRLVEINNYYGDKYSEHSNLMKIIIAMLIPIIILTILNSKGILPSPIFYILVGLISFVGAIYFWKRMISIYMRDPMNYQEYEFPFDASTAPAPGTSTTTSDPWLTTTPVTGTCVGAACCSTSQTYDASSNLCVDNTTETFINNVFTKNSYNYKKPDFTLDSIINPSNSKTSFK